MGTAFIGSGLFAPSRIKFRGALAGLTLSLWWYLAHLGIRLPFAIVSAIVVLVFCIPFEMAGMKPQFTMQSILLATAVVGVALGAFVLRWPYYKSAVGDEPARILRLLYYECLYVSPVYVPLVFAAYVIGRRTMTWQSVLAFAGATIVAIFAHTGPFNFLFP